MRQRSKTGALRGRLRVPGDKSVSHRAVMIALMAEGHSEIRGANLGADVLATAGLARALGARVDVTGSDAAAGRAEDTVVVVESPGLQALHEPPGVVDAGNSGTTMRIGAGICAGVAGVSVLTGDRSLSRRPMLRIVSPLRQMGATIDGRDHGNLPPLTIRGGNLTGIDHHSSVASAQVKTAVLFAGLAARGVTSVTEPSESRDHTERMLEMAGVEIRRDGTTVELHGGAKPSAMDWEVPGDPSAAMFLLVGAAITPGSEITVEGISLNPTRTGALDVLKRMGASIEVVETGAAAGDPVGDVSVSHSDLAGVEISPEEIPSLIDEIPALCVAAACASGATSISGAAELRVKESDRIATIAAGLRAMGTEVEERSDGMTIAGGTALRGARIDPKGDHRIAMAFAVAGLATPEKVTISDWSVVDTSFPNFADVLGRAAR